MKRKAIVKYAKHQQVEKSILKNVNEMAQFEKKVK